MKKSINIFTIITLALALTMYSCGGGDESAGKELKLDTKDVKGTINADGTVGTTELHTNEGKFEVPNIKFNDNCRLQISPVKTTFEEEWTKKQSDIKGFNEDGVVEVIEEKEGAVLFHQKSEFAGRKEEGYNFIVVVKGEGTNYLISGEGKTPFEPIASKEDAEKAFKSALTFKPE